MSTTSPNLESSSSIFEAFLQIKLDRCAFITSWLRANSVPHNVIEIAGKKHIVIRFTPDSYNPLFRMKTLVAHYDRALDNPGANDNSAACYQLMLFSAKLASNAKNGIPPHNIRIFFTDGEEAAGTKGIMGQGAFSLGSGFRKLHVTDDIYVFDACGRGDILVISTSGIEDPVLNNRKKNTFEIPSTYQKKLDTLHNRAVNLAIYVSPEAWIRLPTPYSDNAGFQAAGIPSQVITILPQMEASILLSALNNQGTELNRKAIISTIIANKSLSESSPLKKIIPETWQLMHTNKDTATTLDSTAFILIERILNAIARQMEIASN